MTYELFREIGIQALMIKIARKGNFNTESLILAQN